MKPEYVAWDQPGVYSKTLPTNWETVEAHPSIWLYNTGLVTIQPQGHGQKFYAFYDKQYLGVADL